MGDVILPQWAVLFIVTFSAFIIGWATWATVSIFKTQADQRLNDERDKSFRGQVGEKIDEIKNDIKDIKTDFKNLSNTMLSLFGQEVKLLKDALRERE